MYQLNLAGLEYNHINTQIDAQNARINIANIEIANQQKVIDNAQEVNDFLKNKYTNDELYSYLQTTTRTALYQTYKLAYDVAKKAELAYRYERRPTSVESAVNHISFGYFNQARDGLGTSQQLYLALKNLDMAYQETRGHDYELTKSISLRQLNPYALLTLRETGTCIVDIPEILFDMDFPGHFFRRIKSVTLTVPCVVGPYVGVFELSLKDERYLPFEGAGAISTWQLTLPPTSFRPFDYSSIADVVMGMRYTSCDGGSVLNKAAAGSVVDWIGTVEDASSQLGLLALFDIKAKFAAEWAKLYAPASSGTGPDIRTLVLLNLGGRLPSFVAGRDATKVRATDVSLVTNLAITQSANLAINFKYVAGSSSSTSNTTVFDSGPSQIGPLGMFRISQTDNPIGDWALQIALGSGITVNSTSRMWLIVRYRLLS